MLCENLYPETEGSALEARRPCQGDSEDWGSSEETEGNLPSLFPFLSVQVTIQAVIHSPAGYLGLLSLVNPFRHTQNYADPI